jgi:hypothetical protein
MESFQKRARERRKREKRFEKQARRLERGDSPQPEHAAGYEVPSPELSPPLTPRNDVAPAAGPDNERMPT